MKAAAHGLVPESDGISRSEPLAQEMLRQAYLRELDEANKPAERPAEDSQEAAA